MINTKQVKDRRTLRFDSIDALLADAVALADADRAGRLIQLGNWPLGTAINHLAVWIEFAFDGAPVKVNWFLRLIGPLAKRLLDQPLHPGFRFGSVEGGTLGIESKPADEAMERLRAAMDRLKREAPTRPNELFGRLTHEQWITLQLRHGELHLSFFKPA